MRFSDRHLPTLAVGLILVLALTCPPAYAAGRAVAPTAQTPAPFPCPRGVPPDTAVVRRTNAFPQNRDVNGDTRLWSIREPIIARRLLRAACTLQPATGEHYCPLDVGVAYHLAFLQQGRSILRTTLDASGCTWLFVGNRLYHGQGYWVWFASSAAGLPPWGPPAIRFATLLARALGIPVADLRAHPA